MGVRLTGSGGGAGGAPTENPTFTGVVTVPDGSVSAPSLTNTGDSNTGLFFGAADTSGITAGGNEVVNFTADTVWGYINGRNGGAAMAFTSGSFHRSVYFDGHFASTSVSSVPQSWIGAIGGSTNKMLPFLGVGADKILLAYGPNEDLPSGVANGTIKVQTGTNLTLDAGRVVIKNSVTPASASATGAAGTICWDASYIYICTATDTWKRAAIATW